MRRKGLRDQGDVAMASTYLLDLAAVIAAIVLTSAVVIGAM